VCVLNEFFFVTESRINITITTPVSPQYQNDKFFRKPVERALQIQKERVS